MNMLPLPDTVAARDGAPEGERRAWRLLHLFTAYRLIITLAVTYLTLAGRLPGAFGDYAPRLFAGTLFGYLTLSALAWVAVLRRVPAFQSQVYIQVAADILAVTLLMHASGGIESGLGMLLVVSIAMGGMLTAGRTAGLFAALATLALLAEQAYLYVTLPTAHLTFPQTGMLGATLFATAALAHTLARQVRESADLAEQRGIDLANMAEVTEYIIQHMQTGVLAVGAENRLYLMNATARDLLGHPGKGQRLEDLSPELRQRLECWRQGEPTSHQVLQLRETSPPLLPRFMAIGSDRSHGALIFLEDASAATRQAQQLKLAALGRLTASIAHEVRNPLGAISHAGELLGESPALQGPDRRLLEIIHEQSRRVNDIIESVMQLSRRDRANPQSIPLATWLQTFLAEFSATHHSASTDIAAHGVPASLKVQFDPIHLHQILSNLLENGLRHARPDNTPRVILQGGQTSDGAPYLDIVDTGPGIAPEAQAHVFEPFFTTAAKGTGLGLYLARELAECNQGRLTLLSAGGPENGARFRLFFPKNR